MSETNSHFIEDKNSFVFTLDKKIKCNSKNPANSLYYQNNYGFGFGENDIFIYNNWLKKNNYTWARRTYDVQNSLNGGKKEFSILNFEVYHLKI